MRASIKWLDSVAFVAESGSGHAIVLDGSPDHGGRDIGLRPMAKRAVSTHIGLRPTAKRIVRPYVRSDSSAPKRDAICASSGIWPRSRRP